MALSQVQCLDENNVNPRTHESKPEFFYCEDQRLALETLLRDGRETFFKYLESRGLRGFLSDLELDALSAAVETYDPGKDVFPETITEDEPTPLSQHYWPDLSDTSIPEMDLGWPDGEGYRGVTRTTVYTQPPLDGQAHIKEVVRKMITQAQKVIGVVMDVFTDVDIFRDLMDVGFKRKVSVYILLERTHLPHFLSMCRRANMHSGHLKHLRVRCTEGAEFYTRSCRKVRGRMGHRFMFVDGDKAVSGSYSFTWMSSRLDRNLITVTTGQAVDGFDRVFRYLYANSSSVDLRQVVMEPEPEPEVLPQLVTVVPPSAAVARKMFNPKYALLVASNPSPSPSAGLDEPKISDDPKKKRRKKAIEEDPLPIHPGLVHLEKAYMIPYLPTWPEPDPSSDVIGFINIRDVNKPTQVHLQRSEMFETSQAIRFSSPFSKPAEILPEVAKPRQMTITDLYKFQPALNKTRTAELEVNKMENKAKEFTADKVLLAHISVTKSTEKTPEQNLPASPLKSHFDKGTIKALKTDNKLYVTNTPTNQVPGGETPYISAHIGLRSSSKTPIPSQGTVSHITESLSKNSPKSDSLRESDATKKAETVSSLNTGAVPVYRAHTLESNSTETSQLPRFSGSNSKTKEQTIALHTDLRTQAVQMQPDNVSASSAAVSSPFISENNLTSMTAMHSSTTSGASVFTDTASSLLTTQRSTTQNPSRSSSTSSSLASPLPVPKPRTVQLLIKDDSSNSQVCLVKKDETSSEPRVVHNESPVQTTVASSSVKRPDNKSGSQTYSEYTKTTKETAHPKESLTSKETTSKEADGRLEGKVRPPLFVENKLQSQSDIFITDSLKAASVTLHKTVSNDVDAKTVVSTDYKMTPKRDSASAEQESAIFPDKNLTSHIFDQVLNEKVEKESKTYLAKQSDPQRISYYRLTPKDIGVFDHVDSSKDLIHSPVSPSQSRYQSKDSAGRSTLKVSAETLSEQGKQAGFTPSHSQDTSVQNSQSNFQELISRTRGNVQAPDKTLRLPLTDTHMPGLYTQSSDRESRSVLSPVRTPTPDRFSTPDSRTPTPDLRSHTPDFRTPTPDVSDGYVSSRDDSNLSTTSEEYYECSDSPCHDPVFEHMYSSVGPAYRNHSPVSATLSPKDRSSVWSETSAGPDRGSASSVIDKRVKTRQAEDEENDKGKEEKVKKLSVARKRAESQESDRRDGVEADRMADPLNKYKNSTAEKVKEPNSPKKRATLNQLATDRRVIPGESTTDGASRTQLSSGDLKPVRISADGERPAKALFGREKVLNQEGLRSSAVERREKPQMSRETEEQKRALQNDGGTPSSRPPRAGRPLAGNQYMGGRPWENRQLNHTESKVLEVLEFRKSPSRPSPPAAAGQKQVSPSQQSSATRHLPAVQGRTRAGQTQGQTSPQKPQASLLHTPANMQSQLPPQTQSQVASAVEAQGQDEGKSPFSLTFSKLYTLSGLKDKINKSPAQSKRGSSKSPAESRKSTS